MSEVRSLLAGPDVHICDECVLRCNELIAESSKVELEQERRRAEADLQDVRARLNLTLSDRTDLERVIWLAQQPDAKRVAIIARHLANACHQAPDVPRSVAERAGSLAEELETLAGR